MRELTSHRSRLAGMALVAGGTLSITGYVLTGTVIGSSGDGRFTNSLWMPLYSIALAGAILSVLGLPAILAAHGTRAARLTLVGYVGTFTALVMLNVSEGVIEGFVKPYLVNHGGIPKHDPAGFNVYFGVASLFVVVGLISLGIAVMRARVFARWVGVFLIASVPLSFVGQGLPGPLAEIADYFAFLALITIGWSVAKPVPAGRRILAGAEATA